MRSSEDFGTGGFLERNARACSRRLMCAGSNVDLLLLLGIPPDATSSWSGSAFPARQHPANFNTRRNAALSAATVSLRGTSVGGEMRNAFYLHHAPFLLEVLRRQNMALAYKKYYFLPITITVISQKFKQILLKQVKKRRRGDFPVTFSEVSRISQSCQHRQKTWRDDCSGACSSI